MEVKEEGLNSEVLEIAPEHVIVVRIEDVREQTVLPLEEVNEQVQSDLAQVEGLAQAQTLADELIAGLEAGNENIVDEKQVVFSEINTIDRGDELANAVFALPKAQPDSKQYVQTRNSVGDIVIVELLQVNDVINTEFDAQIESQLQRTSNQADFAGLILSLREQADIEYYLAGAE
jgi:peptidyl-prolyl cis-trans isomerase D